MDKYSIVISDIAKQDIRGIASYIKNDLQEPAIAIKTTDAILDGTSTLDNMPTRMVSRQWERRDRTFSLKIHHFNISFAL